MVHTSCDLTRCLNDGDKIRIKGFDFIVKEPMDERTFTLNDSYCMPTYGCQAGERNITAGERESTAGHAFRVKPKPADESGDESPEATATPRAPGWLRVRRAHIDLEERQTLCP